jgi:PAS domain S-box-containing protein
MQNMQRLFELSKDLLCVAGLDGYFKEINPAFCAVLGYTERELTGVPFLELVHPADRAVTLSRLEHLREGKDVLHFENRYRCKDGGYKLLRWTSHPEGDVLYAIAHVVDPAKAT